MQTTDIILTPGERAYLDASQVEDVHRQSLEHERQEHKRFLVRRNQRVLATLLAIFLIAAVGGAVLALFAFDREGQAQTARSTSDFNVTVAFAARATAQREANQRATQQQIAQQN